MISIASEDFFMRQIEGFTDMLTTLFWDRTASDAVELVYDTQMSTADQSLLIDLRFLLSQGLINQAENRLFEEMARYPDEDYQAPANQFYQWLEEMSDTQLREGGFTREEIAQGREDIRQFYHK